MHLEAEALVRVGVEHRRVDQQTGIDVGDGDGLRGHHGHATEAEHTLPGQAGDLHTGQRIGLVVSVVAKVGGCEGLDRVFGDLGGRVGGRGRRVHRVHSEGERR